MSSPRADSVTATLDGAPLGPEPLVGDTPGYSYALGKHGLSDGRVLVWGVVPQQSSVIPQLKPSASAGTVGTRPLGEHAAYLPYAVVMNGSASAVTGIRTVDRSGMGIGYVERPSRRGYGVVVNYPSGPPGDVTQPSGDDLRSSLRPADELPLRRARRRPVEVHGVDEAAAPIVEQAVAQLAKNLGVTTDQVAVEAAGSVTWSDSSCGCPEPGRSYPQVPVDGVYVRLSVDGRPFHFHGGGRRELFLCNC